MGNDVSDVRKEVDIEVEEVDMLGVVVAREDDVDAGDWVGINSVVVERAVDWTEVSEVDVIDRLSLLEVTIIADGVEGDIGETTAAVGKAVDDGSDGLADDVAAAVGTVAADIVGCKTLRVIHAEEPQKLNVDARR